MKNCYVIHNFSKGLPGCGSNLYSTGDKLINYNTCIVQYIEKDDKYILNTTKYSSTTSKHQNALKRLLPDKSIITISGVPKNTLDLIKRYGKYM